MKMRLITMILTLMLAVGLPLTAIAEEESSASVSANDTSSVSSSDKAASDAAAPEAEAKDDKEEDKDWSVSAQVAFDLGLGAFTAHEYARRIRSRFTMALSGSYTIPVIDVDVYAQTGFSQWMSQAGGSNGQYEFRWSDSVIGFSRDIWKYKNGSFSTGFFASLDFMVPTSTASINMKQYTSISPTLGVNLRLSKFKFSYSITYAHNFHKYTSIALNPNEVDILSRSTGNELLGTTAVAEGGVLTEIELVNKIIAGYQFFKNFGLNVGLAFVDGWTYDNGTITKDDEFVNPNAHVGRGHTQYSQGIVSLVYSPASFVVLELGMVSTQPWKTADNKTIRFPWFDTVSPSKNFTKFVLSATFSY